VSLQYLKGKVANSKVAKLSATDKS